MHRLPHAAFLALTVPGVLRIPGWQLQGASAGTHTQPLPHTSAFHGSLTTEIIPCWKNVALLTIKKTRQNRPLLCLNSTGSLDQLSEVPQLYKAFKPV